jgi:signal peptidase II
VRSPRIRWAVIGVAVLVLAADQVSKALAVAAAPSGSRGGLVWAGLVRNPGASFGIGTGYPVLIPVVAAAVLAAAVIWLARTRSPGTALCLAVVAGGAAGNLADRLLRSPGPGRGRSWTGFTSPATRRRSISRTWPSAPEPSARSWRC